MIRIIKNIRCLIVKTRIYPVFSNDQRPTTNDQLLITNHQPSSGFTLIEILVAATIVALLSTIGVTGYQAMTRNGRDALRKSDLEQVRSALEIYKSENSSYPLPTTTGIPSLSSSYIAKYPSDPKSPVFSYYYLQTDSLHYDMCAHLENGSTGASSAYCNDSGGNLCGSNCNYQVTNP